MHSRADAPKSNPTCTILNVFSLKLKRFRLLRTEISRDREISCKKSEMSFESHWEEHVSLADGNKWPPPTISQPFFFPPPQSLLLFTINLHNFTFPLAAGGSEERITTVYTYSIPFPSSLKTYLGSGDPVQHLQLLYNRLLATSVGWASICLAEWCGFEPWLIHKNRWSRHWVVTLILWPCLHPGQTSEKKWKVHFIWVSMYLARKY